MSELRKPTIGQYVIYVDPLSVPHDALITYVPEQWQESYGQVWTNVVWASGDETRKDNYGRQFERQTSTSHISKAHAPGNYWCFPDEYNAERDYELRLATMRPAPADAH